MAIEKMKLLTLVGSVEEEDDLLEQLILEGKIHLSLEHGIHYDNHYLMHACEEMFKKNNVIVVEDNDELKHQYKKMEDEVLAISSGLEMDLSMNLSLLKQGYTYQEACKVFSEIKREVEEKLLKIADYKKKTEALLGFRKKVEGIEIDCDYLSKLKKLKYFNYRIGTLTKENSKAVKKNQEHMTAVILKISDKDTNEEATYLILYPYLLEEETNRLLRSLNFQQLEIPDEIKGSGMDFVEVLDRYIVELQINTRTLQKEVGRNKDEIREKLNSVYTRLRINQEILALKKDIVHGDQLFILNGWIREKDRVSIEKKFNDLSSRIIFFIEDIEVSEGKMMPPTKLTNHRLFQPFELIVRLYGLPAYGEIDPTPFLAITFMLMFGMMFGDIGQGFVYFLVGILLRKKFAAAAGVLTRLGASSILFGFIYGSLFGLEKHQLPWLPSLTGPILSQANIMPLLLVGMLFGIVVLSISYMIGIMNTLRKDSLKVCIFGKNGIAGYLFFLAFIVTLISLVGIIPIAPIVPLILMGILLLLMIVKEPLIRVIEHKEPLGKGERGTYFTESIFEGIETILVTISNTLSFIRVGAFALNHAGLFMAFLVMSQMTSNGFLKMIILLVGNLLILTLEGLIVFIQGLRLEYYEMFSKYFIGNGIDYRPTTVRK